MNTRATSKLKLSLEDQCMQALRDLPDDMGITDAQQALYDRLATVEDPLAWEFQESDIETAQGLWNQMSQRDGLSIQAAALMASIRGLRAVPAAPIDGYI